MIKVDMYIQGPSIEVTIVSSPSGGDFAVVVDGFNTSSTIATYTGTALDGLPIPFCSRYQFPPFLIAPPDFASHDNHTLDLIFIGRGGGTPVNSPLPIVAQFNSFAIPDLTAITEPESSNYAVSNSFEKCGILEIFILSSLLWNF